MPARFPSLRRPVSGKRKMPAGSEVILATALDKVQPSFLLRAYFRKSGKIVPVSGVLAVAVKKTRRVLSGSKDCLDLGLNKRATARLPALAKRDIRLPLFILVVEEGVLGIR